MNALCEINEKSGQLTKDFNILPSVGHIKSLIAGDAEEIANKIKQKLLKQIEFKRGVTETAFDISPMYKDLVIKNLKEWTKLHKYDLRIIGNLIQISAKGVKITKQPIYAHCGKPLKLMKRLLGCLLGSIGVFLISIGCPFYFNHSELLMFTVPGMFLFLLCVALYDSRWPYLI